MMNPLPGKSEIAPQMIEAGLDVLLRYCPDSATGDGVDKEMVGDIYAAMSSAQHPTQGVPASPGTETADIGSRNASAHMLKRSPPDDDVVSVFPNVVTAPLRLQIEDAARRQYGSEVVLEWADSRQAGTIYRGRRLPIGMTPECFRELEKLFSDFEGDRIKDFLASDAAMRAFEISHDLPSGSVPEASDQ
jgi:hypothetical protein